MYFVNSNHFICVYKIHLAYYSKLNIYLQVSYKEQFYMLRHPFWTSTRLPTASTSNLPRLGFPFGLQHAFPPLQRPIRRALASLLDFNAPSLYFNVQSTTPWLTIIPARQKAPARTLFTSVLAGANPHMYHINSTFQMLP